MRLGVLDIGSNTVHLLVVDAHRGARPLPAYSHKAELRLSELLEDGNRLAAAAVQRLGEFVAEAQQIAEDKGVEDFMAFATSAVREAANGEEALAEINERCDLDIQVLSGQDEARLTFLAVRRWFGWSSGRLLAFDIGGGSLEIAAGVDEQPDVAVSLPLGAGRLTRDWFTADPPPAEEVRKLRKHVRAEIARTVGGVARYGQPDRVVATSKTFKQLARIAGAAPSHEGQYVPRSLTRESVAEWAVKLAGLGSRERAELSGVSAGRAAQLAAGAIVADAAMDLFEVDRLDLCPWALREGVILRRLDGLPD
ncbi:Ppx/GppA family phosphatase [Nonomuraea sp. NPDC050328]|uniref:Ppx/GppA phosphatase family protein n=1 Tax=Nonomuraea sp. NPDC050328 TaxID=3364361 RepID=UPI0037924FF0